MDTKKAREALLEKFRSICTERINTLVDLFAKVQDKPENADVIEKLMREIHTLKGELKIMSFPEGGQIVHALEDGLKVLRENTFANAASLYDMFTEVLDAGLAPIEPQIRCSLVEMKWPLQPPPDRAALQTMAADETGKEIKRFWARRQIERLDRGQTLRTDTPVLLHGIQLGERLRLIGLEGEAVAGLGLHILDHYEGRGVTFPLGYTDGMQMYLPTSAMLPEGGMEVESYWEYGMPAPVAKGTEDVVTKALTELRDRGVS